MLSVLMAIAVVFWILTFFIKGVTLYTILLIIPTLLFCARKIGYHSKMSHIITAEVLFLFFSFAWQLLFGTLSMGKMILCILCRLVFLCVVLYDDKVYVYVNEEIEK